jgi:bifunctional pyridoxal-dependent enzyme with beta-cystathionase and maltose regulon repressor activities
MYRCGKYSDANFTFTDFNIAACCTAFTIISNKRLGKHMQAENSKLTVNKNNALQALQSKLLIEMGRFGWMLSLNIW